MVAWRPRLAAAFGGLLVALVSPTIAGDVALRNELRVAVGQRSFGHGPLDGRPPRRGFHLQAACVAFQMTAG